MDIYGRIVTNYTAFSKGNVPLIDAFASSCNTTFADMSTQLEPGQLAAEGKRFGLGIDYEIPGLTTMTGSVPKAKTPWSAREAGNAKAKTLPLPLELLLFLARLLIGGTRPPR